MALEQSEDFVHAAALAVMGALLEGWQERVSVSFEPEAEEMGSWAPPEQELGMVLAEPFVQLDFVQH